MRPGGVAVAATLGAAWVLLFTPGFLGLGLSTGARQHAGAQGAVAS